MEQATTAQQGAKTGPYLVLAGAFVLQMFVDGSWLWQSGWTLTAGLPVLAAGLVIFGKLRAISTANRLLLLLLTSGGFLGTIAAVHLGEGGFGWGLGIYALGLTVVAWETMGMWARLETKLQPLLAVTVYLLVPVLFGGLLLYFWELLTVGFAVPQVLLPSPSLVAVAFAKSLGTLWADFHQTFIKAVLSGYVMGCGLGFGVAILVDRVPFLQRGLLPLGNLVSALPIVGVAPIMVMWFGFDWQSKAAVVVIMTFFPMLVNTITGLATASSMERDLMHSYAASYWQALFKLRLPTALPFVFNALKINSTLALIGAIVAEFFGTPIVGMGFRISTEVGRMNVDIVWATIAVAALAGSVFYGLIALLERRLTAWHPSFRH